MSEKQYPLTENQQWVLNALREQECELIAQVTEDRWKKGETYYLDTRVFVRGIRRKFLKGNKEALANLLKTEQNTSEMRKRVLSAARKHFRARKFVQAFFEHGQWWVSLGTCSVYSVVDAEGPGTTDGFDFEQVTEGEVDIT